MSANPHEEAARLKKVVALLSLLDRNAAFVGVPIASPSGLEFVRGLSTADWRALAREADVNPPSKATIALVVEAIEARRTVRKTTPAPGQLRLVGRTGT